ncbi:MAG: dihydroxyacetone kinase phosphoryl donor subunit DhaM [Actinomycetia bacterium]|nr:dihydroxyacetone kinase phosphoryl donor subunit DhaM [Actinomycetes bacterium]
MIGIVVVSHSRALARAAVGLAAEMVAEEARPQIEVAAGLDETTFGTDAAAIAEAITAVDSPDGVLVLLDLGSAILSAQMALEFIDPDLAGRTRLTPAPLVEGLVAAVVTASVGGTLDETATEAEAGLMAKREQLSEPDEGVAEAPSSPIGEPTVPGETLTFRTPIRNPHGLHARPAAALVGGLRGLDASIALSNATTGKGPVPASSLTLVQTLGLRRGDELAATITGPEAALARDRLAALAADDFGEGEALPTKTAPSAPARAATPADPARNGRQLVIGPAHHERTTVDVSAYVPGDVDAELARFEQARQAAAARLDALSGDGTQGDIAEIEQVMLADETVLDAVRAAIREGRPATRAVQDQYGAVAAQLEAVDDPYFRARAEDQRGLARLLLGLLMGEAVAAGSAAGVLIVDELDPLTAGSLDPDACLGVITTSGGATGHGVIVAQARGFAVLTGRAEAASIPEGGRIAFDPVAGQLWIDPGEDDLAALQERQRARAAEAADAARGAHEPALTSSGVRIVVEANLSSVADAQAGAENGAEGSGLVRTEVVFGDWDHAPTAEEQAAIYVAMGRALGGHPITIRTWDPGGDKPLPFLPQAPETNPMLGERGLRAMRRLPTLLDEQLSAVLLAARETPVRVMFPMITVPDEVRWARERLDAIQRRLGGTIEAGIMVETPAAAARAADFRDLADFISVGTNDLTQYTMAVDRGNALVADLATGPIEAVWALMAGAAAAFQGKPVAVCGDLASRAELVARLVAIGVTELSVRPPLVGVIKQAVRAA